MGRRSSGGGWSETSEDSTAPNMEAMGEVVGKSIVIGAVKEEPLPGVTATGSLGQEVDPIYQSLAKLPGSRLRLFPIRRDIQK